MFVKRGVASKACNFGLWMGQMVANQFKLVSLRVESRTVDVDAGVVYDWRATCSFNVNKCVY